GAGRLRHLRVLRERRVDLVPPDSSGSRYRRGRDAHAPLRPLRLRLAGRPYPLPGVRGGGSGEIAVLHRAAAYRGADRGMRELQDVREVDRPQPGCAAGAGDRRSGIAVDGSVVDGTRLRKDGAGAGGVVAGSRLIVRVRKEVSAGRRVTRGSPPSPSGGSRPRRRAIRNEST